MRDRLLWIIIDINRLDSSYNRIGCLNEFKRRNVPSTCPWIEINEVFVLKKEEFCLKFSHTLECTTKYVSVYVEFLYTYRNTCANVVKEYSENIDILELHLKYLCVCFIYLYVC